MNPKERNRCAIQIRLVIGGQGGIMQEKELCAKANLLLADLDVARVDYQAADYAQDAYQTIKRHINHDLSLLS